MVTRVQRSLFGFTVLVLAACGSSARHGDANFGSLVEATARGDLVYDVRAADAA